MNTYIGLADLDAEIELGGHISSRNAIAPACGSGNASTPRRHDQTCDFCGLRAFSRSTLAIA
jgi:hypothetical protein